MGVDKTVGAWTQVWSSAFATAPVIEDIADADAGQIVGAKAVVAGPYATGVEETIATLNEDATEASVKG